MNDNKLLKSLTAVLCDVFDRRDIVVTNETTAHDIAEWDSLNHVHVILSIEKNFNIRFKHAEVAAFQNVGDMLQAIKTHIGAK